MIRLSPAAVLLAVAVVCLPFLSGSVPRAGYGRLPSWLNAAPGDCPAPSRTVSGPPELLTTGGHSDVRSVGFGTLGGAPIAVSAGAEGMVRFWRLPGFEPAAEPLEGTSAVYLEPRGRPGVLTEGSYGARLWDLEAREILLSFPAGTVFAQGVYRARPALFAARQGAVRVIDLGSLATVRTLRTTGAAAIVAGRWGGREVLVAYEGDEEPFTIWDVGGGRVVGGGFGLSEENAEPYDMLLTEVGGRAVLLVRSFAGVHRFDLGRGRSEGFVAGSDELHPSAVALSGGVVAFGEFKSHPNGRFAVPAGIVLRGVDGAELGRLEGHRGSITALAAGTLDGAPVLLSGSMDNTVRLWDLRSRRQLGPPSPADPRDGVDKAAVTELDGRPVGVTAEVNGPIRLWDLARGMPIGAPLEPAARALTTQLAAAGSIALTGERADGVEVWDLRGHARLGRLEAPRGKPAYLRDLMAVPPLAVAVSNGKGAPRAYVWDLRSRRLVHVAVLGKRKRARVSLTPIRGRAYAVVSGKRSAQVWDAATGRRISSFSVRGGRVPAEIGHAVEFGCRPALLATSPDSTVVRVLDPATGRDLRAPIDLGGERGHAAYIVGAATVGGRVLALADLGVDDERRLEMWDLTAGRRVGEPFDGIRSSAFAAAGRYVITGGAAEQTLLWTLG